MLTATENGYGKRTPIAEYTRHGRGTQGMIAIQTTERNGKLVGARCWSSDEDEIMLITTGGVLIRTRVNEIREMGRSTQGVTPDQPGRGREARRPGEDRRSRRGRRTATATAATATATALPRRSGAAEPGGRRRRRRSEP